MRKVHSPQISIGQVNISEIEIDLRSRDDIPQILLGLKHIYTTPPLREAVFKILEEVVPYQVGNNEQTPASTSLGRPGMEQWAILVLGLLRLGLDADFDRIHELANQHRTIRQMLGHGAFDEEKFYSLGCIRDNIQLFTPEIMDRINQEVVRAGHDLIGQKKSEDLSGRCDSFVAKTDVHFPTDTNLLFDAIRKTIQTCAFLCTLYCIVGWRQSAFNIRQFKKLYRTIQKLKHSTSKDEKKRQAKAKTIRTAYEAYLDLAESFLERARATRDQLHKGHGVPLPMLDDLCTYISHAERQIGQIRRRVLEGETIPHKEKVFSIFQPHTEWICKGKAGVPFELGLRVCVVEDTHGFILHHKVMEKETDDQIAVEMVVETRKRYSNFEQCSFDKGFHSRNNQRDLAELLTRVVMPKKGKLSEADQLREYSEEFRQAKRRHSAVESAINALQVHGLDKCPDHGIIGFKRYVALAVVARNIQKLGAIILEMERVLNQEAA